MILRTGALMALFLLVSPVSAQLNAYKYIVVPKQFESFNRPNQYQTSTMVKFYLTQKGLPTVWNDARPADLIAEPCSALYVRLADDSNMFTTKVRIRLLDCGEALIYETAEGQSKIKEFKDSYREAIEGAMKSFDRVNYAYQEPAASQGATAAAVTEPAVSNKQAIEEPVKETAPPSVQVPATPPAVTGQVVEQPLPAAVTDPPPAESKNAAEVLREAVPEDQATQAPDPQPAVEQTLSDEPELLYAQETQDGYQLVDRTPSVRLQLLKTSRPDTYIALVDGEPMGSVFREGEGWIHEYYRNGSLVRQPLNIRFY